MWLRSKGCARRSERRLRTALRGRARHAARSASDRLWRRLAQGLSNNADVLVAGARRPIVGTVSMDNLTVDLGASTPAVDVAGSEAVLIGARGEQRITAEEVARRMHTINYEVTCGLTARVPRVYHRDGEIDGRAAYASIRRVALPAVRRER